MITKVLHFRSGQFVRCPEEHDETVSHALVRGCAGAEAVQKTYLPAPPRGRSALMIRTQSMNCACPRVASCRARKLLANSSTGKKLGTPVESFKSADGERAYRLFSK